MKRAFRLGSLLLGALALSGCSQPSRYDEEATVEQMLGHYERGDDQAVSTGVVDASTFVSGFFDDDAVLLRKIREADHSEIKEKQESAEADGKPHFTLEVLGESRQKWRLHLCYPYDYFWVYYSNLYNTWEDSRHRYFSLPRDVGESLIPIAVELAKKYPFDRTDPTLQEHRSELYASSSGSEARSVSGRQKAGSASE